MEKSGKRGKIPQQDWPSIIARYEAGETLSSIARTYDCSPPAISYIVSRSRARNAESETVTPAASVAAETHLVKGRPTQPPQPEPARSEASPLLGSPDSPPASRAAAVPGNGDSPGARPAPGPVPEPRFFRQAAQPIPEFLRDPPRPGGNGSAERHDQTRREPDPGRNGGGARPFADAAAAPSSSEARRTLHLSSPHANDAPADPDPPSRPQQNLGFAQGEDRFGRRIGGGPPPRGQPGPVAGPTPPTAGAYPRSAFGAPAQRPSENEPSGEGADFIGRTLRERVDGDIAAFLAAFDAALDHDTVESRAGLREATDRLLRAGARTRIELERLEARVPLASRDKGGPAPFMRQR
jgi:hypothetical protein